MDGYVLTTSEKRLYISTPLGVAVIFIDPQTKVWITGESLPFQAFMTSPMSGSFWSSDGRTRADDVIENFAGDPEQPSLAQILEKI